MTPLLRLAGPALRLSGSNYGAELAFAGSPAPSRFLPDTTARSGRPSTRHSPERSSSTTHGLEPVLVHLVQGQICQAGVLGDADSVLGAGPGDGGAGSGRSWRCGLPVVVVANAVSRCSSVSVRRSCVRGCGRSLPTITRISGGVDRSSSRPGHLERAGARAGFALGVVGDLPGLLWDPGGLAHDRLGQGEPGRVDIRWTVIHSSTSCVHPDRARARRPPGEADLLDLDTPARLETAMDRLADLADIRGISLS